MESVQVVPPSVCFYKGSIFPTHTVSASAKKTDLNNPTHHLIEDPARPALVVSRCSVTTTAYPVLASVKKIEVKHPCIPVGTYPG